MRYEFKKNEIHPSVEVYHDAIVYLGGINMREFYLDKVKCAMAWRISSQKLKDYFGDLLPASSVSGPPLSYGHLICLGSPVDFPDDGEPNVKPLLNDIDQGINLLKTQKSIQFRNQQIVRHYDELCSYLRQEFPEEEVTFSGLGSQGPLTSAVLLRGQDFIYDIMDYPEKSREFLTLLTDSIISYKHFQNEMNGLPAVNPDAGGLADDFASLLSPDMWPDFVVPFWNRLIDGTTSGSHRYVHCENLSPAHLKYLKDVKITHYQPSVSDMLTIDNIKANTQIPFDWLLYSYHITEMNDEQIQDWVDKAVTAGITSIRTQFGEFTCRQNKLDRIKAFYNAFDKYRVG